MNKLSFLKKELPGLALALVVLLSGAFVASVFSDGSINLAAVTAADEQEQFVQEDLVYDLYVDSVAGDDTNSGASVDDPLKTLAMAEVVARTYGDGVHVGLKRGSHWREDFDLTALADVTVAAYGEGAMPIIDGSRVVPNEDFALTDRANTYAIDVTQTITTGYISIWEDGAMLQFVSSMTDVSATPGSFYVDSDDTKENTTTGLGVHTVYVHPTDSSDITTNGKLYEVTDASRRGALMLDSRATVRHIHTRRNMQPEGSLTAEEDSYVYGSVFEDGVKCNALIYSGTYERSVAYEGENGGRVDGTLMGFSAPEGMASTTTATYTNSIAVCPKDPSHTVDTIGFGGYFGPVPYDTWTITDSVAAWCGTGFAPEANKTTLEHVYSYENYRGIDAASYDAPLTIDGLKLINTTTPLHYGVTPASTTRALTISDMQAYVANGSSAISADRILLSAPKGGDITIARSTAYIDTANNLSYGVVGELTGGATLNVSGSYVVNPNEVDQLTLWRVEVAGEGFLGELKRNAYWSNKYINTKLSGTTINTIESYFAVTQGGGREVGSVLSDPLFANPAAGDFTALGGGLPEDSGLVEPDYEYTKVPLTLAEALEFADQ